jgi:predicted nucleotidyltransferase
LGLSIGSVHSILKSFEAYGLIKSRKLGKNVIYEMDKHNPIFKTFRIFDNISNIVPLIVNLKSLAHKIILYGSCSRGEDNVNSDIDLFILTDIENKDKINTIINKMEINRQINHVTVDTFEVMELEKEDKQFYNEINKGIILWEE